MSPADRHLCHPRRPTRGLALRLIRRDDSEQPRWTHSPLQVGQSVLRLPADAKVLMADLSTLLVIQNRLSPPVPVCSVERAHRRIQRVPRAFPLASSPLTRPVRHLSRGRTPVPSRSPSLALGFTTRLQTVITSLRESIRLTWTRLLITHRKATALRANSPRCPCHAQHLTRTLMARTSRL